MILGMPLIIIKLLQDETGLAIVFVAFIITLYREGLSINFLVFGLASVILFVLSLIFAPWKLILFLFIVAVVVFVFFMKKTWKNFFIVLIVYLVASGIVVGTRNVYDHMEEHQKTRCLLYTSRCV